MARRRTAENGVDEAGCGLQVEGRVDLHAAGGIEAQSVFHEVVVKVAVSVVMRTIGPLQRMLGLPLSKGLGEGAQQRDVVVHRAGLAGLEVQLGVPGVGG